MQRFKNILCVVSTDLKDNTALEHAVKLAENNQASITVVEVIDEIPPNTNLFELTLSPEELQEKIVIEYEKKLEELVSIWNKKIEIKYKVLVGNLYLEIIYGVLRNKYDLVVKMAENGGIVNRMFGSDDMHLLRKCPCPVWIVKQESNKEYQRILAAVDVNDFYSPEQLDTRRLLNLQVLEMALSLALLESAEMHVVHAWDAIGESVINLVFHDTPEEKVAAYVEEVRKQNADNMDELMHELTRCMGQDAVSHIKPQSHLIKGYPRKDISLFAKEIKADLVVMGTVARTGIPGLFMGNTAESILNQLNCSVLAVKPSGFMTPVTLDE